MDCFVIYLTAHNRPMHEVLAGNDQPLEAIYNNSFVGMTKESIKLEELLKVRRQLRTILPERLGTKRKKFLHSFAEGNPNWALTPFEYARNFPAIKWKLHNLKKLQGTNPDKLRDQLNLLDRALKL